MPEIVNQLNQLGMRWKLKARYLVEKIRESQVIIQITIHQRAKLIYYTALVDHNLQHPPPPPAEALIVYTTFAGDHNMFLLPVLPKGNTNYLVPRGDRFAQRIGNFRVRPRDFAWSTSVS